MWIHSRSSLLPLCIYPGLRPARICMRGCIKRAADDRLREVTSILPIRTNRFHFKNLSRLHLGQIVSI